MCAPAQELGRQGSKADDVYRAAVQELGDVVARDGDVQRVILDGIRERISDNQYEISSIPFELFQNADDAASEFQQLQAAEGRAPFESSAIGRFVFEQTDSVVRFLHWGRPVNFTGRSGNVRSEFGSDLERMLMLGATGKTDAEEVTVDGCGVFEGRVIPDGHQPTEESWIDTQVEETDKSNEF